MVLYGTTQGWVHPKWFLQFKMQNPKEINQQWGHLGVRPCLYVHDLTT
jgi:hypothetical protein